MDIVGSICKFANLKRLYIIDESRSGKLYIDGGFPIDPDDPNDDEKIYKGGYCGGLFSKLYTVWVHAYSAKEAKNIALERIYKERDKT